MVIKSLSRKSNSGSQLVNYVFRYIMETTKSKDKLAVNKPTTDHSKLVIKHNIRSRSINGFIKDFQKNESYRLVNRRDSIKLVHTILAFSGRDREKITEPILKDIANKFISLRGANNLYCGTAHWNTNSIHLHIISSGTQLNGRSSRVSKQKFKSIKIALQEYQKEKYPQLSNSIVNHNKTTRLQKEALVQHINTLYQTNKETIVKNLEGAYLSATSKEHFLTKVKEFGYDIYTRNNKLQGITIDDTKYRFSRLGFPDDRLKALSQSKGKVHSHLADLENIRAKSADENKRDTRQTITDKEPIKVDEPLEQKDLDELSDIRNDANEKGRELKDDDDVPRQLDQEQFDEGGMEYDEQEQ